MSCCTTRHVLSVIHLQPKNKVQTSHKHRPRLCQSSLVVQHSVKQCIHLEIYDKLFLNFIIMVKQILISLFIAAHPEYTTVGVRDAARQSHRIT